MTATPFVAVRMRSAEDEARSPKYAHIERERRWLIDRTRSAALHLQDPIEIRDRYLIGTRMRLREMRMAPDRVVWKLTKKYQCADPLARPIVSAYLAKAEYEAFARLPAHVVEKVRFRVTTTEHDYSVDRFKGAHDGLELAEIELQNDAELRALPDPDWAIRDISADPRYQGGQLAEHGIPAE